jgi:hypothetical protein
VPPAAPQPRVPNGRQPRVRTCVDALAGLVTIALRGTLDAPHRHESEDRCLHDHDVISGQTRAAVPGIGVGAKTHESRSNRDLSLFSAREP